MNKYTALLLILFGLISATAIAAIYYDDREEPGPVDPFGIKPDEVEAVFGDSSRDAVPSEGQRKEGDDGEPEYLIHPDPNRQFSLVRLLAVPEKYHQKKVEISGYLIVEFEGDAIYLDRESAEYGLTKNALWVDYSDHSLPIENNADLKKLDKQYVTIWATFAKDHLGHGGMFSGGLEKVTRIMVHRKVSEYEKIRQQRAAEFEKLHGWKPEN